MTYFTICDIILQIFAKLYLKNVNLANVCRIRQKGAKVIRKYFDDNCISIRQWAKKHNLKKRTTYAVINGEIAGKYNTLKGSAKKVFEALLSEGIIDEMPSAFKDSENQKAS